MPKISELSDPGSGHTLTGQEKLVAITASLSTISLSASDLVSRSIDVITSGQTQNFKATHTDFKANSAEYESAYSTVNANSARNARTALSVETNVVTNSASWNRTALSVNTNVVPKSARWERTALSVETNVVPKSARWDRTALSVETNVVPNSADWNYVAANSGTLKGDTTVSGALSGNSTLIINGRGTFGGDHIVTDNILTVFGNISAQGTVYASGSALGDVDPVNPGGSNRTIQYNDSNAFGGAAQFAYDETNHNVGIGTQAIAIADNIHEKLTVSGNISATETIFGSAGKFTDRVGIGTTAPDCPLTVSGSCVDFKQGSGKHRFDYPDSGDARMLQYDDSGNIQTVIRSSGISYLNGGNVGIGTGAPTSVLHISGAGSPTLTIASEDGEERSIQFNDDGAMAAKINCDSSENLEFKTGGSDTNKAIILANGNVGLNTNAPGTTLTVAGSISAHTYYVRDDLYVSKYIRHTGDTNTYLEFSDRNDRIALGTSGSSHLTITSAGFVGLGTTEPAEQFHIYKGPAAAGIPTIRLSNQIQAWNIATRSDMDNNLTIRDVTRGDNLVNILTGGNVGIGTDNPGSKLHVAGDSIRVDGGQGLEFGGTNEAIYGSSSNGFITWYTQGTEKMKLSGGRLGLGTSSPNGKLNVSNGTLSLTEAPNGNADELVIQDDAAAGLSILTPNNNSGYIIFGDTDDSSRGQFIYDHSSDSLKIHVNNAERAVINSSGSFGIGTTAPGYKLHVVESNTSTVAISAFGEIHAGGDIVSSSSSDRRQKTNIKNLDNALDKVLTLDGVEYDWNEMAAAHRVGKHDVGVIAQQVEEVLPDAIDYREDGMMAVRYERIIPLLIESIKELKSEIDELKGK
jgi:hypothetical protein